MRTTTVITVKIEPYIYDMILRGQKRFEVCSESFHGADFICYVNPETDNEFPLPGLPYTDESIYYLGPEQRFDRDSDEFVQRLAGISKGEFYKLFPRPSVVAFTGQINNLYAAPIGERITNTAEIFQEESLWKR
ncbi:MAG: hypothetical protein LKI34_02920 [Bifidobacterium tibiigranuli]|jgi:hypothetical protein|uniref:hypothetical protein n=1 Tax=Bifidobacterium tibiigranuli TaxID=2172043 RepID=UPI0026ED2071|nr:hypothetical protein [Bifidobacterium tibiigranuli]MCI1673159.1 hypothetical protein [Bifidobacterium tibiigranuli]MCI1713596.1 hypothetical protein [Bifidobacterium tibiigranuli]